MSDSTFPNFMVSMHVASRLFAGLCLLLAAVVNGSVAVALFQLILSILILLQLDQGRVRIYRSLALLRWLLIPTIVLHALFTPGELILSGMAWPVSVEGLQIGLWFALHLSVIFFAATLFSQLLMRGEWIEVSLRLPVWGARLLPYILLMERCRHRIRLMVTAEFSSWRKERGGLKGFVMHLSVLPVRALQQADELARELWDHWEQQVAAMLLKREQRQATMQHTLVAIAGGLMIACITLWGGT